MIFNRYIVLSVLTHLLLFGLLAVTQPDRTTGLSVFDIDLVDPIDLLPLSTVKVEVPKLSKEKSPIPDYNHPSLPDNKLSPDTMHGEDSMSTPPASNAESSGDSGISAEVDPSLRKEPPLSSMPDDSAASMRSRLFDRDTIEKFANNAPQLDEKKGLAFDVGEFKHRGYMRMLRKKIESIWEYPKEAARLGISGDLYIDFVIKKDGKLGKIDLVRTSGFSDLDKAAMKALKDAEPFWPLPEDWEKEDLEIKGHFLYILGGDVGALKILTSL